MNEKHPNRKKDKHKPSQAMRAALADRQRGGTPVVSVRY